MNLPNKLTVLRAILIPFFLVFLLLGELGLVVPIGAGDPTDPLNRGDIGLVCIGRWVALAIFIIATATDYLDGVIARKYNLATNFGRLMDPLADKLLVMAAYVAFVQLAYFPAWVVCVILAREFMVTGLRQIAVEQGRVLQADRWGKNKTIAQMFTAVATLFAIGVRDTILWGWPEFWFRGHFIRQEMEWWMDNTIFVLMAIVVFFTIASGWRYFRANADILRDM